MSRFLKVDTALGRLAENTEASVLDRVKALKMMQRVPLLLLRRLLHRSRKEPGKVPLRLVAAATLIYAREKAIRKLQPRRVPKKDRPSSNALGI